MTTSIDLAKQAVEAEANGEVARAIDLWEQAADQAGTASERRIYRETAINAPVRARKIAGVAITGPEAAHDTTGFICPHTGRKEAAMAKQYKKRLRKIKDRIVHCANDVYSELSEPDIDNDARAKLEDARALLIEVTNRIVEAING